MTIYGFLIVLLAIKIIALVGTLTAFCFMLAGFWLIMYANSRRT